MDGIGDTSAHSPNKAGAWHRLDDHLREVGDGASAFGGPLGLSVPALWVGRWHDIGKVTDQFQRYLAACVADPANGRRLSAPHKMAGAVLANQYELPWLALAIAGHHGGMPNWQKFRGTIQDEAALAHNVDALTAMAAEAWLALGAPVDVSGRFPAGRTDDAKRRNEVATRLLFSCLVDADFLDTEAHFDGDRSARRFKNPVGLVELKRRMSAALTSLLETRAGDAVASDRDELFSRVVARAGEPQGLFTLTAPTGSGKTVTGLGFALAHAEHHDLRRVVMAAPFVSITEQTAGVYSHLLDLGDDKIVVEHHSGASYGADEEFTSDAIRRRLATENWDAEVVVTTTVQLLDSLFSNRPKDCRKLHRLARSVIVIDEAQSIPFGLLDPTLDMLRELCDRYGATVVLSTATQPPFGRLKSMTGVALTELVDEPAQWSRRFARVSLDYRPQKVTWDELAEIVCAESAQHNGQCLVVLNTIDDAAALTRALSGTPGLTHLSTRLCPSHRRAVLDAVRRDLLAASPCLLVATQVVEAGVDVSFPIGVRAVGPGIALAQVAGRINRHGEREHARLVVVEPEDGHCPPGDYKVGRDITRWLLADGVDVLSEPGVRKFYDKLFLPLGGETDKHKIQAKRAELAFEDVAGLYNVISDDTVSVLVDWGASAAVLDTVRDLPGRMAMRRLQPFLVSLRKKVADEARKVGLIAAIPGFDLVERWAGTYDSIMGAQLTSPSEEW